MLRYLVKRTEAKNRHEEGDPSMKMKYVGKSSVLSLEGGM